jgi:LacI family transcriptional regulator
MEKKITIYDVAQKAGVAISTVSRVLNDSAFVSESTRDKVLEAIDELGFRPQISARKLASQEPQIIGIVVPSFTTPFFNEVLKGVKDEIQQMDLDVVIFNTGSSNPKKSFEKFLDRGTADTLIVFSIAIDEKIHKRLQSARIPVILIGSHHPAYDYIEFDNYTGGYMAGRHLAEQGFEKIGMITPAIKSQASTDREQGFRAALKDHDLTIDEDYFLIGDTTKHAGLSEEAGFEVIYKFKEMGEFPEAIFCANDTMAIGAINALSRLGMSVPDDVAVMGHDNIKFSRYIDLSTIDQKMYDIGTKAMHRLDAILNDDSSEKLQISTEPTLIERNSTKNVKNK